ncbi:MAG: DUF4197 domain-containing protein [Bacteroidales bacterium]|jgi:hypothetical protein|nr:DUF4197 domain-containing protein [Bacteroidales bacterium]
MKKIKILLFILISVAFFACKDESGDYATQLYTDTELVVGIKDCLYVSMDTANAHLAVTNGFFLYNDKGYRLHLPTATQFMIDSLYTINQVANVDTLILHLNGIVEKSGGLFKTYFNQQIRTMTIANPSQLVSAGGTSITDYYTSAQKLAVIDLLKPQLEARMTIGGFYNDWQAVLTDFTDHFGTPAVYVDFSADITRQAVESMLKEMAKEELLIRKDSTHRVRISMNIFK